jgi:SAM-dependent methyltransferase
MWLYAVTILLSSFLLFQVQPILARLILPWFGGTAAVWTVCLLFFQTGLLLGYLYAHWSSSHLTPKKQVVLHWTLLAASLLVLPILPDASWKPTGAIDPAWRILGLLSVSAGLPYFLLSTSSPLLQVWYTRAGRGTLPYRLYALSNLGSMLALLSYPPLVEPFLGTKHQAQVWSAAYFVFAVLCGIAAATSYRASPRTSEAGIDVTDRIEDQEPPGFVLTILWIGLAASASTLLLAVTNYMTQDVAAVPFLWILPLSLYLLSFIICFRTEHWYRRDLFILLLVPAIGAMSYLITRPAPIDNLSAAILVLAAAFFVCCMVCHGELARSKPHPRYLTSFYLMIAIGGAGGGVFVGLIAPRVFSIPLELPVGMTFCAALALLAVIRESNPGFRGWGIRFGSLAILLVAGFVIVWFHMKAPEVGTIAAVRNFYGILRVTDYGETDEQTAQRILQHGLIEHGMQLRDSEREPTTYYCRDSGVGLVLSGLLTGKAQRIGVIGLGAGTLACYGKPGDYYRFYEINPAVVELAHKYFTFLKDSPAKVDVVLGDARLSLEREENQHFSVLALDAFSSDAIPVHLLTREAFAVYFRHLNDDGILAVHISNRYLDLWPVVRTCADAFGRYPMLVKSESEDSEECDAASWVLISRRRELIDRCMAKASHFADDSVERGANVADPAIWTDDYSNLFGALKRGGDDK